MKKICLLVTVFLCLIYSAATAQVDPDFHLYILIGQSNMAGRGPITDEFKGDGNPRVLMLNKDLAWIKAQNPLHFDKLKVAGVRPGLAFGIDMAKESPNVKIGLIPCVVGGTPIKHWKPGAFDKATSKPV